AEVSERIAKEYDVLALAAVHRVGKLAIGDAAVIVATAAPHRGEAFEASRALIDELKATVPIWKHQVFADGTDEWVGTP
ncbi:MAG: molybdenum cofactor biosynthesis protein MoaE, partial [Pseudonocardia sp.]